MRKKCEIELRDLILLYLAGSAFCGTPIVYDLIGDIARKHNFSSSGVYKMVTSMQKKGFIEKRIAGHRITSSGFDYLNKDCEAKRVGPWDGKWRVVVFDIPESKRKIRDTVRACLKTLGLGMLQKSVWVTAYDLRKEVDFLAKQFGISRDMRWFVGETVDDPVDFAYHCWNLSNINENYKILVKDGKKLNKLKTIKDFIKYKAWEKKYYKLLTLDPRLPAILLPLDWQGNACGSIHHNLKTFYKI